MVGWANSTRNRHRIGGEIVIKTRFYLVLLSLSLILCSAGCLKINYYESNHAYRVNSDSILFSFDDGPTENTFLLHETDGVVQNLPNIIKKMNQVLGK